MKTIKILIVLIVLGLFGCQKEPTNEPIQPNYGYLNIVNSSDDEQLFYFCTIRDTNEIIQHYIIVEDTTIQCEPGSYNIVGNWLKFTIDEQIIYYDSSYVTVIENDTVDCYLTPVQ